MFDDFSEYQMSESDKYKIERANHDDIEFDIFNNSVQFDSKSRRLFITVDSNNEYFSMFHLIEQEQTDRALRLGNSTFKNESFDNEEYMQMRIEQEAKNQDLLQKMKTKYTMDSAPIRRCHQHFYDRHPDLPREPFINIFSGSSIEIGYGEGIIDFIYADFRTPLLLQLGFYDQFAIIRRNMLFRKENCISQFTDTKFFNETQLQVENFYRYRSTFESVNEIAYSSLYSAIYPPKFNTEIDIREQLKHYSNYLETLQQEYLELMEFCFDEEFSPGALHNLNPAERFALFRKLHHPPDISLRFEKVSFSDTPITKTLFPEILNPEVEPAQTQISEINTDHRALSAMLGIGIDELIGAIRTDRFISVQYECCSLAQMLELEFTKILEANIRFRRCKRCGKYFIMKGNYATNYCGRVAPGETRNCQELAAAENYKAKIADNKAIQIYNKYYKRYAARVKVRQIKETDFKKWKYRYVGKKASAVHQGASSGAAHHAASQRKAEQPPC